MAKFSENQMTMFIHLYETHYCLWKSDSPDYKNRDKRESALQNIVDEMNIDGFTKSDCKTKIKNIRSHYCQELKKIKASMKSGSARDDVYKPKLPWFAALDGFLRPVVMQKTESNLQATPRDAVQDVETTYDENERQYESPETLEIETTNINTEDEASTSTTVPLKIIKRKRANCEDRKEGTEIQKKTTRKKTSVEDCDNAIVLSAIEKLEEISSNASQASKKTEFDVFGQSVAAQLNAMPLRDAIDLQLQIQQLITKKRISTIQSGQTNVHQSNTAPVQYNFPDHTQDSTDDSILSYFDLH